MGVELLKIGVKMRKGVVFTVRGCFRSIWNHPFLVVLLSVLIYMYRSSPFMFSLLVYASPVLVCTAILLGTLLLFGQPNLPEVEIDEKTAHEAVQLKTELSKDSDLVEENVERNESYFIEKFSEARRVGEQPSVGAGFLETKVDEIRRVGSIDATALLSKERSPEDGSENGEILEARRELDDDDDDKIEKRKSELSEERLSDGEVVENNYASIPKASDIESDYEKSEADSFDSERVNVDSLESSAWKQVEQPEDEEEEDDGSDSGSDQAESSSPDASMADIIPMLDELHPLLDEEGTQPVQMSRVGSNAPSSQSGTSSIESVDETDNQEDSEVADDDIDNEDDDDAQGDKEDQIKTAISWTEEDQKNLMLLGSSEIERNQRLENLIMRRKTRKHMSMVPEINLIDLESSVFPIHVASINTTRQNPFDLPLDSYDNSGLPPIPGSAPSILLPRRNPFDIPYDSTEEKPNQMGDGLLEEVKTSQSRDPFFRRRESFNVGPSVFAPSRQDIKWRPYIVPERMVPEESSYSTLECQSSEMSDSKASSVPKTESVSSVEDLEDRKLEEDPQEVIEVGPLGDQDQVSKREPSEEDESQSLEGEECLELGSVKKREIDHVEEVIVAQPDSSSEAVDLRYSRGSGASSLSEVSVQVFTKTDGQDLSMSDDRTHIAPLEPDISRQTSDLSITSTLVGGIPHKEPVYDLSPNAGSNVRGHDSINSDFSGVDEKSDEKITGPLTQGDKNLGELEEEKPLPISERESPTPVEGRLEVEHLIDKGETVQSPKPDGDYHQANAKISTPTAGESTSLFDDSAMHESDFEHLQEVQVPNTPVESHGKVRSIQNIHIPVLHELDHGVLPNTKSSVMPDSISKPSEEAVSHVVDTQTILEEVADEIKENHAGLLSESDTVGEKHVDSSETSSSTNFVEVNSGEENKIQHEMHLEDTRDETVNDVGEVSDVGAKTHEDVRSTTSDKETAGRSKSTCSSSSDSEENKKAMFAKRRLSTPF